MRYLVRFGIIQIVFAGFAVLAEAATDPKTLDPKGFDSNNDMVLSSEETRRWLRELDVATGDEAQYVATYYIGALEQKREEYGQNTPLPVALFNPPKPLGRCLAPSGPVLRSSIKGSDVLSCEGVAASKEGAKFSYTRDRIEDDTSLDIDLGLAFPLGFLRRQLGPTTDDLGENGRFTERLAAIYFEADGLLKSNSDNDGTAEAGLLIGWRYEGGRFLDQAITSLGIFTRTDLEAEAEIYGAKASFEPFRYANRLGGLLAVDQKPPPQRFFWTLAAELEGLSVKEPGTTQLAADTEYLWTGLDGKFTYKNDKIAPYGIAASLGVKHHIDVLNGDEATVGEASIDFFLDRAQKTSLQISHETGTLYKSLEDVDKFKLNFTLKF